MVAVISPIDMSNPSRAPKICGRAYPRYDGGLSVSGYAFHAERLSSKRPTPLAQIGAESFSAPSLTSAYKAQMHAIKR